MHLDSSTFQLVKPGKPLKALYISISIKYVETIYLMDCFKVYYKETNIKWVVCVLIKTHLSLKLKK